MINCQSYKLLSSLNHWNQVALANSYFPITKCLINTISLVGYAAIFPLALIEFVVTAIFDTLASIWNCHISFKRTVTIVNVCYISALLVYKHFKRSSPRVQDLH